MKKLLFKCCLLLLALAQAGAAINAQQPCRPPAPKVSRELNIFTHLVSLTSFSQDGKRLFVLTANQAVYVLNVAGTK